MLPYTISQNSITVLLGGIPKVVDATHPNYHKVLEAIKANDVDSIEKLIDVSRAIVSYSKGKVKISNGVVYYGDIELENYAVDKLLELMNEGFDITPLTNFLANLMENPSYRAVKELYKFLEVGGIPITEDGYFMVYKKVTSDFKDIYTRTFDNSVGKVVEIPRNMVDEDSSRTCSSGLHVCSYSYLSHFGNGTSNRVVLCKVNPKDVVSIPADYNNTKMRVCRYEVVDVVKENKDILRETKVYVTETPKSGVRVGQYNSLGKLMKTFNSAKQAEMETDVFATNIIKCCRGHRNRAGGYIWKYI